jgi:predicted transposase/invertase (TIGR01784 family)
MNLFEWSNEQAMRVQRREGLEEGIGIGEARGERKTMIKAAQRLFAMGVAPSTIAQVTGLTIDELESLRPKH